MPLPLLRLPEKLTVDVLRSFGIRELLAISLLSKRAKNAVKLLKLRTLHGNLYIGNSIKLDICSLPDIPPKVVLEFYTNSRMRRNVLNILTKVMVTSDEGQIDEWKLPASKMTMKDWHIHIGDSLCKHFFVTFEAGFSIFNFESIKKSFKGIEFLSLSIAENMPHNQSKMILNSFLPTSHDIELKRNPFSKKEEFHVLLIENREFFSYGTFRRPNDFTLNDMLMCNFAYLYIYSPTWTDKEINRFLKLCLKGACPRLSELAFLYLPEDWRWNQEEVLKGISFQGFPGERQIRLSADGEQITIEGGYDIHGKDGGICSIEVVEPYRVIFYLGVFR